MTEIVLEVGRLIGGHPMVGQVKKNKDGTPKMRKDGEPQLSFYAGVAIVKKPGETHWNQTAWGQQIWATGAAAFPNGEFNALSFAWKVEDGDSTEANKKGKIPNQREGWAGHWIIHASDGFPLSCYHDGKFNPYESIQDKNEIKGGDYCQIIITVSGNNIDGPTESPGVYLNLKSFILNRAGIKIVSASDVDVAALMGAGGAALPAGAQVDTNVATPVTTQQAASTAPQPGNAPPPPATDFVQNAGAPPPPPTAAEVKYMNGGVAYTKTQLLAAKWTEVQIEALPKQSQFDDDIPF